MSPDGKIKFEGARDSRSSTSPVWKLFGGLRLPAPERLSTTQSPMFSVQKITDEWDKKGGCLVGLEGSIFAAEKVIKEQVGGIEAISDAYIARVRTLRSELKNDSGSVEAATARIKEASLRAVAACKQVVDIWNSKEMADAIANAERLASALRSISELQNASITFAVIDKKSPP